MPELTPAAEDLARHMLGEESTAEVRAGLAEYGLDPEAVATRGEALARRLMGEARRARAAERRRWLMDRVESLRKGLAGRDLAAEFAERFGSPVSPTALVAFRNLQAGEESDPDAVLRDLMVLAELDRSEWPDASR